MSRFYALHKFVPDENGILGPPPGSIGVIDLSPNSENLGWLFITSDKPFKKSQDCILLGNNNGKKLDQLTLSTKEKDQWNTIFNINYDGSSVLDYVWNILTDNADTLSLEKPNPLIPTHKGVLELHLGGHSLIKKDTFKTTTDTHKQNIINWEKENLKREYSNYEQEIDIKEKEILKDVPNKVLGNLVNKYKLDQRYIKPDELKDKISAKKPTTTIGDDFTRADITGSWGTGPSGFTWTKSYAGTTPTINLTSNRGYINQPSFRSSLGLVIANINLSSYDQYSEATFENNIDWQRGVSVNSGHYNSHYTVTVYNYGYMHIWISSTSNIFASAQWYAPTSPSLTRLERDGSTLRVYFNGSTTPLREQTHTGVTPSLRTAVGHYQRAGNWYFNYFEAGDLLAGSPGQHYAMMMRNK